MKNRLWALALALLGSIAESHEFKAGDIRVVHPYAVPSLAGVANGQGFVDFTNRGAVSDSLMGVSTPAAQRVEIHEMKMDAGVMRMSAVAALPLPAGKTVELKPGGYHVMLGDKMPVTLKFARAGDVRIEMWVQDKAQGGKAMHEHHQK